MKNAFIQFVAMGLLYLRSHKKWVVKSVFFIASQVMSCFTPGNKWHIKSGKKLDGRHFKKWNIGTIKT